MASLQSSFCSHQRIRVVFLTITIMIDRTKTQHSSRRQVIQIGIVGAATVGLLPKAQAQQPASQPTHSKNRFTGKVVAITGSTSGIGRAAALAFAREGAKVGFCGRRENLGAEVEQQIRHAAYTSAKRALLGLAQVAALDYGQQGIRVNVLSPGITDTPLFQRSTGGSKEKVEAARQLVDALKRIATAEEIAEAALFLASNDCPYITGVSLLADGGMMSGL